MTPAAAAPLTDLELIILYAIIGGPVAWSAADYISASVDLTHENTIEVLTGLVDSGWVDAWDRDGRTLYTLSCLGAERLGFVLEEVGDAETLRWSHDAASARPHRRRRRGTDDDKQEALEQAPDPAPDHTAMVAYLDHLNHLLARRCRSQTERARRALRSLPDPSVCVGMSNPVYLPSDDYHRKNPLVGKGSAVRENLQNGRVCKGCRGLDLEPYECCPRCSNWGLQGTFDRLLRAAREVLAA